MCFTVSCEARNDADLYGRKRARADAIITGSFPNESFGAWVASAGGVNNDGVQDLIVGAPRFPKADRDT
jgi:hypothetical protein